MTAAPWWWRKLHPEAIWWSTRLVNEFQLRVTSAWRSRAAQLLLWRTRKGAAKVGAHPLGWGVDHVGPRAAMELAATFAREHGAREVLIHNTGDGLHLHVDWRGAR